MGCTAGKGAPNNSEHVWPLPLLLAASVAPHQFSNDSCILLLFVSMSSVCSDAVLGCAASLPPGGTEMASG